MLNKAIILKLLKLNVYCPTKSGAVWNNTNGTVILVNFLKPVAPSISAASYSSAFIDCKTPVDNKNIYALPSQA